MTMSFAHRPDLQGLRAIAVLLVVLAHAEIPPFSGGFIGVDVFFVLSGYLISGLLIQEHEATGHIRLLEFYARRLKRLMPALLTMLCLTSLATWRLLSGDEARSMLASIPYAASWTSNLYFSFREFGYFDDLAMRDVFLHTWSLSVEEQFYLLWPILLPILLLRSRNPNGAFDSRRACMRIGVFTLATLAIAIGWSSVSTNQAFYLTPARIWQFSLGTLVWLQCRRGNVTGTAPSAIGLLWGGLVLIIGSAIAYHPDMAYPGGWALAPSAGAAMVIYAGSHSATGAMTNPLTDARLTWIGDRSYSIYLWHWPVLMLGLATGVGTSAHGMSFLLALTLLLAILSYRLVELPFWKGSLSRIKPRTAPVAALLVVVLAFGTSLHLLRAPEAEPDRPVDPILKLRLDAPEIYRMPCDAWYRHARLEPCVFETKESSRTIVMLADSIGAQWFSAFAAIHPPPEWRIVVLTKSACTIVDEDYFYARIGKLYTVCTDWRNAALDAIHSMKPEVVVVGSSARTPLDEMQWIEGSARVFARLSQSADRVIVIAGTPNLSFDGPGCALRHADAQGNLRIDACFEAQRIEQVAHVTKYLQQAAGRFDNVGVIDLNPLVCPDGICAAVSPDGIPVFRDRQHLSDRFVRSRTSEIRSMLEAGARTYRSPSHEAQPAPVHRAISNLRW